MHSGHWSSRLQGKPALTLRHRRQCCEDSHGKDEAAHSSTTGYGPHLEYETVRSSKWRTSGASSLNVTSSNPPDHRWLNIMFADWVEVLAAKFVAWRAVGASRFAADYRQHEVCKCLHCLAAAWLACPLPPEIPPSIGTDGSGAIPSLKCINIVVAHLLFGGETITELVKYQIGAHRRHAAYQDHQHPFHGYGPTFSPIHRKRRRIAQVPRCSICQETRLRSYQPFSHNQGSGAVGSFCLGDCRGLAWVGPAATMIAIMLVSGAALRRVNGI